MVAKIRVLTVSSGLAIGGAERFAIELACSLDRGVFEPLVCALWRRGDPAEAYWAQRLAEAGITVLFARGLARAGRSAALCPGPPQCRHALSSRTG